MIPFLMVTDLHSPLWVLKTSLALLTGSTKHPRPFSSIFKFGDTPSPHGSLFFLFGRASGGFLGNPSNSILSPGSLPAGGVKNSMLAPSGVSAHITIPCDM